jgi:hypothetical protein
MTTLICATTTLLIAVGALILAVAGRAALDPEVIGHGRASQFKPPPMNSATTAGMISQFHT